MRRRRRRKRRRRHTLLKRGERKTCVRVRAVLFPPSSSSSSSRERDALRVVVPFAVSRLPHQRRFIKEGEKKPSRKEGMMMRDEIHLRFSINLAKKDDDTKDDKKNNTTNNEDNNKNVVFSLTQKRRCARQKVKNSWDSFSFFSKRRYFFL